MVQNLHTRYCNVYRESYRCVYQQVKEKEIILAQTANRFSTLLYYLKKKHVELHDINNVEVWIKRPERSIAEQEQKEEGFGIVKEVKRILAHR